MSLHLYKASTKRLSTLSVLGLLKNRFNNKTILFL